MFAVPLDLPKEVVVVDDCSKDNSWEVVEGLKANGIDIKAINAGIPSNTAANMLARMDKDVLARNPDWMIFNSGVNDYLDRNKRNSNIICLKFFRCYHIYCALSCKNTKTWDF